MVGSKECSASIVHPAEGLKEQIPCGRKKAKSLVFYHCLAHHHHLDDHGDSSVACVVRLFVPRVRDRFALRPTSCTHTTILLTLILLIIILITTIPPFAAEQTSVGRV